MKYSLVANFSYASSAARVVLGVDLSAQDVLRLDRKLLTVPQLRVASYFIKILV